MVPDDYLAVLLAARPQGTVRTSDFKLVRRELREPGAGEVLVRNHWLSLDPYMRGRMNDAKSYAPPAELGEVMVGSTAGIVELSRHPDFAPGDAVIGSFGWQEWGLSDGLGLVKVDASRLPLQTWLGAAGMPGITAWYGIRRICEPEPGETFLVSAASGAVGAVAGQLARLAGARVVGIAGGAEKCAYVRDQLGFDACVDYKEAGEDLVMRLADATPDGVDSYFDNVGGTVLNAALQRMNKDGRIAMCGMIAGYNGEPVPIADPWLFLTARLRAQGFIISDHLTLWPQARAELATLVESGRIRYRESVSDGLESAPEAFIGLLAGRNLGKQLVRLLPAHPLREDSMAV